MPTPYSSDDLGRLFDAAILTRGRTLVLLGAVEVKLADDVVSGVVEDRGVKRTARAEPAFRGRRVVFDSACTCGNPGCVHLAATLLSALDRFPTLRKPEPKTLFEKLGTEAPAERQRISFELEAGSPPFACFVTTSATGQRSGNKTATTPAKIVADPTHPATTVAIARLLGSAETTRTGVPGAAVPDLMPLLARSGQARWTPTGKTLSAGEERVFQSNATPRLPPKSAILLGKTGPWYVDAATGHVGRIRVNAAAARKAAPPPPEAPRSRTPVTLRTPAAEQAIVERPCHPGAAPAALSVPRRFRPPAALLDALILDFDYGGTSTRRRRAPVRARRGAGRPTFVRRDREAEAAALDTLRQDGFMQMRVADRQSPKGRRVFVFRGRDAGERWHGFVAERVPALQSLGFRSLIDRDFGPRLVESRRRLRRAGGRAPTRAASRSISASRSTACAARCCRS